ncbi:type II secretion system minor pseudopilin GspJ [Glaciecola sp. 1036]|uniref:type II secretion system minor pseudopilin GspJ n=1 Tax=Alteromonadaceae TaxID=72275 RepID=UPI003CFE172F
MSNFPVAGQSRHHVNFIHRKPPRLSSQPKSLGFTLIELLIAVAIFAIIAIATGAVLSTVSDSNETSEQALKDLQDLQRAMLVMERDMLQMVSRVPRIQGQQNQLVINGGNFEFDSDEDGIAFVRNGWHNPQLMLPRSSLQNVTYRLQDNQLQRLHTNYVDAVIGTEPKIRVLFEGVTNLQFEAAFQFSDDELDWQENIENTELPIAVKVEIETDRFGTIERIFQVAIR